MDLSGFAPLYKLDRPVVTAYLEQAANVEDAAARRDILWKDLLRDLGDQDVDGPTIAAIEAAKDAGELAGSSRVIIAAGGTVHLDRVLPEPAIAPELHVAPLPRLLPLIAWESARRPHLVVLADHVGADILVYLTGADDPTAEVSTPHADWPVHKTGTGGWAAKRFEASVEESWERSARQVAELVANLAHALGTTIIIASGEPKTLSMLAHELPGDLSETFTTVPGGGRHKDGGEAAVADRVAAAVAAGVARDELAVLERFAAARGRGEGAVEGAADVVEALQQAQVGTLIIASAHADSSELAWFGPEPTQFALKESDLAAMGVSEVHQGALVDVLLRAAAGSGAAVLTVSDGVDNAPREGIGGLLRFDPNAQVNSVA